MRYLGIDYGSKRIGLALSDESNAFALPYGVLDNSKHILEDIKKITQEKGVTHIVMGESKNYKGEDNKIMAGIRGLKETLEKELNLEVVLEPEFLTSHQAEHFQGKHALLDASAAAIILQSYLEKIKNTHP